MALPFAKRVRDHQPQHAVVTPFATKGVTERHANMSQGVYRAHHASKQEPTTRKSLELSEGGYGAG